MPVPAPYIFRDALPAQRAALVLDSPHSGVWLPEFFSASALDTKDINDLYVDELLVSAPAHGAALLSATIGRLYIDLNRAVDDTRRQPQHPAGGLIRPWPGQPFPLPADEIAKRISSVWQPYHDKLAKVLRERRDSFGQVLHLNVHSMPSSTRCSQGSRPDIVLGNLAGLSAAPNYIQSLTRFFATEGLKVTVNDPFSGAEIVRRHGNPSHGVHSVQVEINRALFVNEAFGEKNSKFPVMAGVMTRLIETIVSGLNEVHQAAE